MPKRKYANKMRNFRCPLSRPLRLMLVWGKVYKTPYAEIVEQLSTLLNYRGIIGEHVPVMSQALYLSLASSISFVDAMVFTTARQHGWQPKSFDKKLNKLSKSEK